jgi:peptide/nickel transport system permease protein
VSKHPLARYYLKKAGAFVFTLWAAFTITFFTFHLLPVNPVEAWIKTLEKNYSFRTEGGEEMVKYYNEQFGLNGTLIEQYARYMKNVLVNGDLGPSFVNFPTKVQELIAQRLPWTIALMGVSVVLAWVLGLIVGLLAGWSRGTKWSGAVTNVSIALSQIPPYLLAIFLVLFFGYQLRWLPSRGAWDAQFVLGWNWRFIGSALEHAILPASAIVLTSLAGWILSTRSLIIGILGEDYLTYAEAKGLKTRSIMRRYALRNALLPQVTGLALTLGAVMNGTLLIEILFVYPGIGELLSRAIGLYDFNTVLGVILLSIASVMTASLVVDILLPIIDPRIRTGIQST